MQSHLIGLRRHYGDPPVEQFTAVAVEGLHAGGAEALGRDDQAMAVQHRHVRDLGVADDHAGGRSIKPDTLAVVDLEHHFAGGGEGLGGCHGQGQT